MRGIKVGALVRMRYRLDLHDKIGLITSIGSPNPIAKILWKNGDTGAMHIKWLKVVR